MPNAFQTTCMRWQSNLGLQTANLKYRQEAAIGSDRGVTCRAGRDLNRLRQAGVYQHFDGNRNESEVMWVTVISGAFENPK